MVREKVCKIVESQGKVSEKSGISKWRLSGNLGLVALPGQVAGWYH